MNPLSKLLPINFLSIIKWTNSLNSSTLLSSSIPIKIVTETTTINQIFPLTICLPSHYTIMQPYHSNRILNTGLLYVLLFCLMYQLSLWRFFQKLLCVSALSGCCGSCRCLWGPVYTQSSTLSTEVNVGKWDSPDLSTSGSRGPCHCWGPQHTKTGVFLLCFCH